MKNVFKENPKLFILLGLGIPLSIFSFVYEYVINYDNLLITYTLMSIDLILLLINMFYLSYLLNNKIGKSIVNAILLSLLYFVGIVGVIMGMAEGSEGLNLLLNSIRVLVYLGPSIIILLPVIYIFCLALG